MSKKRLKKGFTIIELIVVIAVLGILVLLALPKFLGYTEKAKVSQVKNDIVAYEKAIDTKRIDNDKYIKDWEKTDVPTMESLKNSLFNKKGLIGDSNEVTFSGEYYKIPKDNELVKTHLKGDFYLGQDGEVYYYDENLANKGDNETPTDKDLGPTDKDLGYSKDDFTWVKYDYGGYIGKNGEMGYFQYTGTGRSTVEIPHVIQGIPMTSYYSMFENSPAEVTKVISTNKNVTSMCLMFNNSQAKSLDLSELDTSNVTDMNFMFASSKAESLKFEGEFNTSKVENMSGMFSYSQATSLDLSNFNTSNVTDMSYMFSKSKAESLKFEGEFNTSKVENMSEMFDSSKATSLDLSNFNTSNVKSMGSMFYRSEATSLDLSNFNTSNVTNMRYMFGYSKIKSITFGTNFDTSNVTNMSNMFNHSEADTLDLSSFNTSKVEDMSNMFSYSKAKSIIFGTNFDTSNVTNMRYMFDYSEAGTLDLSSFDTSNVTDMSYMLSKSLATEVYARTQADADKFNRSADKPQGLQFIVGKPQTK